MRFRLIRQRLIEALLARRMRPVGAPVAAFLGEARLRLDGPSVARSRRGETTRSPFAGVTMRSG